MSTTPTPPWWQTSLKITAVVLAFAAVAIWAPWPINVLAVVGAVVFLLLSLRNPDHWLRRLATGCIGVLVSEGADAALLDGLRRAAEGEGAKVVIVAPRVGGIEASDGKHVDAQEKLGGGP